MSQSMLQTEMTDAVNTGIVDRADKSEKSLKSGLYTVGKRASTGGAASAALSSVTSGRKGKNDANGKAGASAAVLASAATHKLLQGSELEGVDDAYHAVKGASRATRAIKSKLIGKSSLDIRRSLKSAGKAAGRGAVSNTLKDTELEGADNLYDVAVTGYHVVQGAKKRLSGKDALSSGNSLGKLSEKKSAKKAMSTAESKRRAQAAGYFKKNVYSTAEKVKSAQNTAKGIGIAVRGTGSAGGGILAAFSPSASVFGVIIAVLLLFMLLIGGLGADETQKKSTGSLQGVAAEVATYLKGYGYTNEAIAGILGNMQQESSMNPGTSGDDGYGTDSIGLIQLTGSNKNRFLSWCVENGKTWWSVSAQMEWSFSGEPGTGYYIDDWGTNLAEAPSYYRLERGYEPRFESDFYRSGDEIKASTDVDLVTYSWMACHERCGSAVSYGDDVSRLNKRLEYAHSFLSQLRSGTVGGGQDYESAEQWQKDIVNACHQIGWPGANLCATWTTKVYAAAGHTVYGNGNSVLGHQGYGASYYPSRATTDLSQIQVGMLVSAQFGSNTAAGNTYGHVGIYIGDGMVMDSVSSGIRTIALSDWVSQNGRGWVVCGYPWDWR